MPSTRALLSPHEMFQLKVIIKRSYLRAQFDWEAVKRQYSR